MPGGRPRLYSTPEEMQAKVDEYFATESQPTMTGMILFLGFVDRRSASDYEQRNDEFSPIIKNARARIERLYESIILYRKEGQVTGPIFALKQFGWTDKTEQVMTFTNKPTVKFEFTDGDSSTDRPTGTGDAEGTERP